MSVMLVYCGQKVGWIKMKLGVEVGFSPGYIVLDGDPAPSPKRGTMASPHFSAHVQFWPSWTFIEPLSTVFCFDFSAHKINTFDRFLGRYGVVDSCKTWNKFVTTQILHHLIQNIDRSVLIKIAICSTNPNQWPGVSLSFSTTGLVMEAALLLVRLADANARHFDKYVVHVLIHRMLFQLVVLLNSLLRS